MAIGLSCGGEFGPGSKADASRDNPPIIIVFEGRLPINRAVFKSKTLTAPLCLVGARGLDSTKADEAAGSCVKISGAA